MTPPYGRPPAWPSYQVFQPEETLRRKAFVAGSPKEAVLTANRKAAEALAQLAGQFPQWMQEEADRLRAARDELQRHGFTRARLDRLFTAAHDIRGQAATYDFPIAGDIAAMLCTLIDLAPAPARIPAAVVDQHVDAILAVVRQNVRGRDDPRAASLIGALQVLNEKTLQRLSRQAQAEAADATLEREA